MNTNKPAPTSLLSLLDHVELTDVERIRAEAEVLRAEFIADLVMRGVNAVRVAVHGIKPDLDSKTPRHLGPTA